MPDWIGNRLIINGPRREVQQLVDEAVTQSENGQAGLLDFKAHAPVPAELVAENPNS
jgi:hypothetical protein